MKLGEPSCVARPQAVVIDGPRAWVEQHKSQDARDIEKIAFVPWRSELSSTIDDPFDFDGTEAIREMDRKHRA